MSLPERLGYIQGPFLEQTSSLIMAKPDIPVEKPKRRAVPQIPDPMPHRLLPAPSEPVKMPREPVPAR